MKNFFQEKEANDIIDLIDSRISKFIASSKNVTEYSGIVVDIPDQLFPIVKLAGSETNFTFANKTNQRLQIGDSVYVRTIGTDLNSGIIVSAFKQYTMSASIPNKIADTTITYEETKQKFLNKEFDLPQEYILLESLKLDGRQYINTFVEPDITTKTIVQASSSEINGTAQLLSTEYYYSPHLYSSNGSNYIGAAFFSNGEGYNFSADLNKKYTFKSYPEKNLQGNIELKSEILDGENLLQTNIFSYGNKTISEGNQFLYFGTYAPDKDNAIYHFKGNIYYCEIEKQGKIIRQLIPCYNLELEQAGFYDASEPEKEKTRFYPSNSNVNFIPQGNKVKWDYRIWDNGFCELWGDIIEVEEKQLTSGAINYGYCGGEDLPLKVFSPNIQATINPYKPMNPESETQEENVCCWLSTEKLKGYDPTKNFSITSLPYYTILCINQSIIKNPFRFSVYITGYVE